MVTRKPSIRQCQAGLTLVELIVIIAVIGFFAAMTVPTVANIVSESVNATAKRNAQNIATAASIAEVMGSEAFDGITNLKDAVAVLVSGSDTSFRYAKFAAGDLTEDELDDAMRFLRFEKGVIIYSSDPSRNTASGFGVTASSLVSPSVGNF